MELGSVRVDRLDSVGGTSSRRSSSSRQERTLRDRRRERLNTELLAAAALGDQPALFRLLEEGASVNATCRKSRQTALHIAADMGHNAIVDILLAKGAQPDARDREGRQPAHLAAWKGHLTVLNLLQHKRNDLMYSPIVLPQPAPLVNEADLDSWNHKHGEVLNDGCVMTEGSTPLHLACKKSHVSCVNFLLLDGIGVDARDALGLTPLDVVGVCSEKNAESNLSESTGSLETISEELDTQVSVLHHGFDSVPFRSPSIGKMSKTKLSPVKTKRVAIPSLKDAELVKHSVTLIAKSLLENGAKMPKTQIKEGAVRNQSKTQVTALHTAVQNENVDLIRLLLQENGCMMSWNDEGETPLHLAVKGWMLDPLKEMLTWKEAPYQVVDARDSLGRTLLHLAVMQEWPEGVSFLLECGADVKTSTNSKQNVFHLAAERGNLKMLEELLSVPDSIKVLDDRDNGYCTALCKAVDAGSLECTKMLVENGADPTVILPGDISLLHLAAENNFHDILKYLLTETDAASLKDARCRSERGGTTPLQTAALLGVTQCVEVILSSGCDVRCETTEEPHLGSTAAHLAARHGHEAAVDRILSYDPGVLASADSRGWYPLHVAASRGHARAVASMIKAGADLSAFITDEKGDRLTGLEIILYCVPQPLDFLVQIFDSYITVNDYPISDPNCEIEVKFDVLIPQIHSAKQLKVLNALLNSGREKLQEKLLLHPIVETFLHLKWRKLRFFFVVIMSFYLMFTFSLTALAILFYVYSDLDQVPASIFHCTLFMSLGPIILAEGLNVLQLQRYYVCDYESWVKWTVFVCSVVVGLAEPAEWWARHLTAITVLLAWVELLFLVARCPTWGFYVLMFSRVAIKIMKVLLTFTFLLLGFSFAFMIEFNAAEPFSNMWRSTVKVMVMMLEFDYEATFENVQDAADWFSFVARGMFLVFVVLVAIVLMNLMVGLAVSDITLLETQGRTQRLAKQISFLSLLELFVCSRRLLGLLPGRLSRWLEGRRAVLPSVVLKAGGASLECGDTCLPLYLKQSITEKVLSFHRCADSSSRSLSDIVSRLDRLENQPLPKEITQLKDVIKNQAQTIEEIQKYLQILLNNTNNDNSKNYNSKNNCHTNVSEQNFINTNYTHFC